MSVTIHENQSTGNKEKHEHRWRVVSDHWQCEICGRTFGLKTTY